MIAGYYSKQPIADEAAYQKKLKKTRAYFRPDMEVLEFGCGTGSTAITHAPYVKHIQATDVSPKMLKFAQDKADANNIDNVSFQCTTIEELNQPDESLDVVLGLSILHLLENKEAIISKVHKLLKPGGVFVTSTACIGDDMKFFKYIAPIGRFFGLMPYLNIFTARNLENSLTEAGFKIDYQWQPGKGRAVFIVAIKE
jgi:2-polyprenyl-3-methyl-5-hydroxy-6-metoxy-1,4-benzoquinol methylase